MGAECGEFSVVPRETPGVWAQSGGVSVCGCPCARRPAVLLTSDLPTSPTLLCPSATRSLCFAVSQDGTAACPGLNQLVISKLLTLFAPLCLQNGAHTSGPLLRLLGRLTEMQCPHRVSTWGPSRPVAGWMVGLSAQGPQTPSP